MAEKYFITEEFPGFFNKRDLTQLAPGALVIGSQNVEISDTDRVATRRGSKQFSQDPTTTNPCRALHTFKKRDGSEIMLRAYGQHLEYLNKKTGQFENLNSGYSSSLFGFADHNVNDDIREFTYFCNAIEPYSRWNGAYGVLTQDLSGSVTEIKVDTVLTDEVFDENTASATTDTTITIANAEWAADIWDTFYVHITSGTFAGRVSQISATTSTQITFDAITGLNAETPTFEIRQAKYDDDTNKNIRIGGNTIAYTGFSAIDTITLPSTSITASKGDPVAQAVEEFPGNPRGNILFVLNTRMFVANVKGKQSSLHYSTIADATSFAFSVPRVADEGGIIDTPEGGGGITAGLLQEDFIYLIKEDLIKTLTFTNDAEDFPIIKPLISAPQVGAISQKLTFKIDNKPFYVSPEGGVKEVGRVADVDFVQPDQLSDPIKLSVQGIDWSDGAAQYFKQKAYISGCDNESGRNNVIFAYNTVKRTWEAPIYGWNASSFTIYENKLYFGSSLNEAVWEADVENWYSDGKAPIACRARFAYNNYGEPAIPKSFDTIFMEGYISANTTIDVTSLYNYFGTQEKRTGSLSGTESQYIVNATEFALLGNQAIALYPLAGSSQEKLQTDLFKFRIYFETKADDFYEHSIDVSSNQQGGRWEILRFGTNVKMGGSIIKKLIKKLAK